MGRLIDGFYFGPLSIRKPALPRLRKPWIWAPCQLRKILQSEAGCYLKCQLISTPSILVQIGDSGKRNGKGGVLTSIAKSYSVKLCFIKNVMLFLCRELADPRHSVLFIFWYPKRQSSFSIFLLTPFLLYRRKLFVGHWQMNFLWSEVTTYDHQNHGYKHRDLKLYLPLELVCD